MYFCPFKSFCFSYRLLHSFQNFFMRSNWARTPSRQSGSIFFCRLHITLVVPDWQCCPGKGYTKKAAISHKDQRVHSYILKLENANEQQQVNTSPLFQRIVRFCFLFDHIILGINNINKQSDPIYAPNFQTYYCPPVKNFFAYLHHSKYV